MNYNPTFYEHFDQVLFRQGANVSCGPVYNWVWNSEITETLIDTQLEELYAAGVWCFYILPEPPHFRPGFMETHMSPAYLSGEFFRLVRYAAEVARDRGMTLWIYDEAGWPSGSACGAVTDGHPEWVTKCLYREVKHLCPGEIFFGDERVISAFAENKRVSLPFTAAEPCSLTVYGYTNPDTRFPYLLDEGAIRAFLDCTYERYYACLGDLFGSTVQAVFTDEAILHYPFYLAPADLANFEEQYGHCFADQIPALFGGMSRSDQTFRADYIDYCGTLFAHRYLATLRRWCNERGLLFTGHMNGDHELACFDLAAGNLLTHLRQMDLPGVDAISRQIHPSHNKNLFPRFAASAAHQTGGRGVLSESFAVYGSMPYRELRAVCTAQFVRGVNLINPMLIPSGRDRFLGAQLRPAFLPENPDYGYLPAFNRYLSRLQYLCRLGKGAERTAVYVPFRDEWAFRSKEQAFWDLCRALEARQICFDLIDDDFLRNAHREEGELVLGDARYTHIFLPPDCTPSKAELATLDTFRASGGKVCTDPEDAPRALLCDAPTLRVLVRQNERERLYLLCSEAAAPVTYRATFPEERPGYRLNCMTGEAFPLREQALTVTLHPGEECAVLFTETPLTACKEQLPGKCLLKWSPAGGTLIRESRFSGGSLSAHPCARLLDFPTAHLSGQIRYELHFSCTPGTDLLIELDEVHDCAALRLNGQPVGESLFPPHWIPVDGAWVQAENRLEITVCSSAAAAYAQADVSDIPPAQVGPYHPVSASYEADHTLCGLAGTVTVYTSKK